MTQVRDGWRPTAAERTAGFALMAVLAVLAAWLVTRGSYYAETDTVIGPAPDAASLSTDAPPPLPVLEPEDVLPAAIPDSPWVRLSAPETYTEERLHEKIGGADQRYKSYGVRRLMWAEYGRFAVDGGAKPDEQRLGVFVCEMRTSLAALGIFGKEMPRSVEVTAAYGDASFVIDGGVFFRKGRFYVQLVGSSRAAGEAAAHLGWFLAQRIPSGGAPEIAFAFLPQEGRRAGSERFDPEGAALGTTFLRNVFSAEYGDAARPVMLFAADLGSPEAAAQIMEKYAAHLARQGKVLAQEQVDGVWATLMDLDGLYDGFCVEGGVFAGVVDAADQATLRRYLALVVRSVRSHPLPRTDGVSAGGTART